MLTGISTFVWIEAGEIRVQCAPIQHTIPCLPCASDRSVWEHPACGFGLAMLEALPYCLLMENSELQNELEDSLTALKLPFGGYDELSRLNFCDRATS
jgi:hypothetical protein